jgi:hypothetical protein
MDIVDKLLIFVGSMAVLYAGTKITLAKINAANR